MSDRLIRIPPLLRPLLATLLILTLAGCSAARSTFNQARDLEKEGRVEEAMYRYAEAFRIDPEAADYRLHFLKTREQAARRRLDEGHRLLEQRAYADAREQFQAAAALNPSLTEAEQHAAHAARLEEATRLYQEGLDFERTNKPKLALQAFQRALELQPDNPDYHDSVNRSIKRPTVRLNNHTLLPSSPTPLALRFRNGQLLRL